MAGTTRRKPGWMGPYIESLRAWLLERGYTPGSIKQILTLAGQLGRWMQSEDVKFSQLDSAAVASFLDALRARGVRRVRGRVPFDRCWTIWTAKERWRSSRFRTRRSSGWWPCTGPGWWSTGGPAAATVMRYENLARRSLGQQPTADGSMLAANLTAADVVGVLLRESERVSVGAVTGRVAELRSLLRFLYLKGFTPTALASAVPPAAGWYDTGIPVGLSTDDAQRLLDGCDRANPDRHPQLRDPDAGGSAGAAFDRGSPVGAGRHRLAGR